MWPFLAALGSGLFGWFGQQSANRTNRDIANSTNFANAQQWREYMQWQERMSNTSYQRAVADMKAAGINPMAMASGGFGGSSTPSAPPTPMTTGAPMQNTMSNAVDAFNSAINAKTAISQVSNLEASADKLRSDIGVSTATAANISAKTALELLKMNEAKVKDLGWQQALKAAIKAIQVANNVAANAPGVISSAGDAIRQGAQFKGVVPTTMGKVPSMIDAMLGNSVNKMVNATIQRNLRR